MATNPTPEEWAATLVAGIGVYSKFPADHAEFWPEIEVLVQRQGYRLVADDDDDAWYARPVS